MGTSRVFLPCFFFFWQDGPLMTDVRVGLTGSFLPGVSLLFGALFSYTISLLVSQMFRKWTKQIAPTLPRHSLLYTVHIWCRPFIQVCRFPCMRQGKALFRTKGCGITSAFNLKQGQWSSSVSFRILFNLFFSVLCFVFYPSHLFLSRSLLFFCILNKRCMTHFSVRFSRCMSAFLDVTTT